MSARSLLDLHVHTRHRSQDSALAPDDLARRAIELGLSAVCITEHNACWTPAEATELAERFGIPVIPGIEVETSIGHVLAFGIGAYTPEMWHIERLSKIAESEGGALVLAHPLRPPGIGRPWDELGGLLHGLEVHNADESALSAADLLAIATRFQVATTGGSDAHVLSAVGRCLTEFEGRVTTVETLVAAIHARQGVAHRRP